MHDLINNIFVRLIVESSRPKLDKLAAMLAKRVIDKWVNNNQEFDNILLGDLGLFQTPTRDPKKTLPLFDFLNVIFREMYKNHQDMVQKDWPIKSHGMYDVDEALISVTLLLDPETAKKPQARHEAYVSLFSTLRHEIQHVYQTKLSIDANIAKRKDPYPVVWDIDKPRDTSLNYWRSYWLSPMELDAFTRQAITTSKKLRKPFKNVAVGLAKFASKSIAAGDPSMKIEPGTQQEADTLEKEFFDAIIKHAEEKYKFNTAH